MPATSKSQQRLMGMVHAYNQGKLGKVSPELKKKIKRISKSMKKRDVRHFAETSHEELPRKKNSEVINDIIKISNHLDSLGLTDESDELDRVLISLL